MLRIDGTWPSLRPALHAEATKEFDADDEEEKARDSYQFGRAVAAVLSAG